MKKTFILFALLASCVLFFASCISVRKLETAKTRDVAVTGLVHLPTVATLDVSQTKVTELFTINAKKKLSDADKAFAVSKLLTKYNADVLVEPRYTIEVTTAGKRSTFNVIVSGYPATYKNFRPLSLDDIDLLNVSSCGSEPKILIGTFETE